MFGLWGVPLIMHETAYPEEKVVLEGPGIMKVILQTRVELYQTIL